MSAPTPAGQLGWRAPKNVQLSAPLMIAQAGMGLPVISSGITVSAPATPMAAAAHLLTPTTIVGVNAGVTAAKMGAAAALLAPSANVTTGPTFDAKGTAVDGGTTTTISETHTAAAGADVYAFINMRANTGVVSSITYGGTAMTLLAKIYNNGGSSGSFLAAYRLTGAPGGTQTVTATATGTLTSGWSLETVSYTTIATATPTTAFGGTPASQALTCGPGQMIVWAAGAPGSQTITAISGGTQRFVTAANSKGPLVIQDSTVSTTFAATFGALNWYAMGVVLA